MSRSHAIVAPAVREKAIRSVVALCWFAVFVVSGCGGDNVTNPPANTVNRIDVTASTTTLAPAQSAQLTAIARSAGGSILSNVPLAWSSSATGVATVSSAGTVTAIAAGTSVITAQSGGVSGQVTITVVAAGGVLASVTVTLSDVTIDLGNLVLATAGARDANGQPMAIGNRPLVWSSTNPNIAVVGFDGVVLAVGVGSATIRATVTDNGNAVVGSATLSVTTIPNAPQSVDVLMPGNTFSPSDVVVRVNGTVRFVFPSDQHNVFWKTTRIGFPADINTVANQTVTRVFATAGVFPYDCTLHPGMSGTVIVAP